jgi:hypothetical protein
VRHVGLHSHDEGLVLGAVEEHHVDGPPAAEVGDPQPVHPVDDPHRRPVHHDGRQRRLGLGQQPDVLRVLAAEPGRITGPERADRQGEDSLPRRRGEPLPRSVGVSRASVHVSLPMEMALSSQWPG